MRRAFCIYVCGSVVRGDLMTYHLYPLRSVGWGKNKKNFLYQKTIGRKTGNILTIVEDT